MLPSQVNDSSLTSPDIRLNKMKKSIEIYYYFSLWLSFATKHSLNQATDQGIEEDSDAEAEVMIEQDDDTDDETYGGVQGRQSEKELY